MKPRLSRANQSTSVLQELHNLLSDRPDWTLRSRHNFSHHVLLMTAEWASHRRDEGAGKSPFTPINDVIASRDEALRIKLIVCNCRPLGQGMGFLLEGRVIDWCNVGGDDVTGKDIPITPAPFP